VRLHEDPFFAAHRRVDCEGSVAAVLLVLSDRFRLDERDRLRGHHRAGASLTVGEEVGGRVLPPPACA
jgi:hypothetical protein